MRVGVISRGSPDYLIDIVADGLIRLLGRPAVSLDYNVRKGVGSPYDQLFHRFAEPDSFAIHEAEILIASVRSLPEAAAWMARTGKRKVAIVDGEDDPVIREPWPQSAAVYFKREYLAGIPYGPRVRPLPFAAVPETFEYDERRPNPLFYLARDTHPYRRQVVSVLVEMGFRPASNLPKSEYNRILSASLIGVSVRGLGWDTYRYWEIPYFGAAMIAQRMPLVIPGNFEDGAEAVFFDDPEDFRTKVGRMLRDREGTLKIARTGRKACLERHLSVNRAKTVLEALA